MRRSSVPSAFVVTLITGHATHAGGMGWLDRTMSERPSTTGPMLARPWATVVLASSVLDDAACVVDAMVAGTGGASSSSVGRSAVGEVPGGPATITLGTCARASEMAWRFADCASPNASREPAEVTTHPVGSSWT